ncbi:MAG: DNA polymerase III subunit beta [Elusimicrobiota bacterium]|jgi:DNA polymerase-3 subunit beta|nr:DNA polymerase III subunit beta [Elusimicrobiota bacterium]
MKVICEKEVLSEGLDKVSSVTSTSRSALPVLSNFLFATDKDSGKIKLSSTDLETAVQCYIKAEIIEEGAITIPTKRFFDIVKEIQNNKESTKIEITSDETNKINIKSHNSHFDLTGISKTEYPEIPSFPKENNFSISKDTLIKMLKKTVFSTSKDTQRYVLNGVCFVFSDDGKFEIAATDARRLAYIWTSIPSVNVKSKFIVPTKAVNEIIRLFPIDSVDENINIGLSDNHIAFEIGDITLTSTLIDGAFPNYEQIIPKDPEFKIKLNVESTLAAVRLASLLTGEKITVDKVSMVVFTFSDNNLNISAKTAGIGEGEVNIEVEYKNAPIEIKLNPDFVKEILQNCGEEFIYFEFTNTTMPIVFTPEKNKCYICIVMPMRA